ncbi:kinase-like protein, partial [Staphylotrichum tortipilum]
MAILHLHHLARHVPLRQLNCWTSIRTASTVVGKSGRIYIEGDLLRRRRDDRNTFKAESGNESFVLKHVPTPFYRLSTFLPRVFSGARRLRLAVDSSDDDNVLVYPYFRGTLFDLIQANPDLSVANRKEILRHLAEAIQELHSKDLIHLDVKPQNVFVNWTCNEDGTKTITDVALADLWHAQRSERGEPYEPRFPVGDMAWRSLEAHVGRAITKASDMYSFGLVCAYAFGGGDMLLLRDEINEQELQIGSVLEAKVLTEVLSMRLAYFGLPTEGLLEKLDHWSEAFKTYSRLANQVLKITPELRFEVWGASFGSKARDMILGLTKSDPAARLTVDQVLAHPWWEKQ